MTTRRHFIAGLLATAAAPACPAQPATVFPWAEVSVPLPWVVGPFTRLYSELGPASVHWSANDDLTAWGTP